MSCPGCTAWKGWRQIPAQVCTTHKPVFLAPATVLLALWGKQSLWIVYDTCKTCKGPVPCYLWGRIPREALCERGVHPQASVGPDPNRAPVWSCSLCRLNSHSFLRALQEFQRLSRQDLNQMPCHSPGKSPKVTGMCHTHALYTTLSHSCCG